MRTGLDKFFADNFIIALLIAICCAVAGPVLSIIGVLTCKDPKAKNNATICLVVSLVLHAVGFLSNFVWHPW